MCVHVRVCARVCVCVSVSVCVCVMYIYIYIYILYIYIYISAYRIFLLRVGNTAVPFLSPRYFDAHAYTKVYILHTDQCLVTCMIL